MRHKRNQACIAVAIFWLSSRVVAQLVTIPATVHDLPEERSFDGRIEAIHQATVSAETRGRIEEIRADIGDVIAAGTVILIVTSTEQRAVLTRAEAALAEANSTLIAETAEFQRTGELHTRGLIAKAELDRATARFDVAKARVDSAEATLRTAREQLSYTEIRAPYAGVVSARFVEPGEMVQPGTLLMSGYDPDALRIEVDLPQTIADKVRTIGEARIMRVTDAGASDTALDILPTKLVLYPTADAATSTVRARLELPPSAGELRPGQFVKVLFTVGSTQRLLIPRTSVVQRSEVTAVYVVQDGVIRLRQIRPGAFVGDQLEVLAGLAAGEEVAVDPVAAALALRGDPTASTGDSD